MLINRVLVFFSCLLVLGAKAQDLNFININTDIGLPSNECYRIVQDKKGYIWVSTEAGLAKYNGRNFILFDKSKGMPGNNVYALDVDSTGRIWFATGDWKVGYILDDSVTVLKGIDFYNDMSKAGDVIYKIQYSEARKSLLVSFHHGSIEIVTKNDIGISKKISPDSYARDFYLLNSKDEFYTLNLFNINRTVFITDEDIKIPFFVNYNKKDSFKLNIENRKYFFSEIFSTEIEENKVLLCLLNYAIIYDFKNKKITKNKFKKQVQCLYKSPFNKDIWIGYKNDGVYCYKNGNLLSKPLHYLTEHSVSGIIQDNQGTIWVTTTDLGLFYCFNNNIQVETYYNNNQKNLLLEKIDSTLFYALNDDKSLMIKNKKTSVIVNQLSEKKNKVYDVCRMLNGFLINNSDGSFFINHNYKYTREIRYISNDHALGKVGFITNKGRIFLIDNIGFYELINNNYFIFSKTTWSEKIFSVSQIDANEIIFSTKSGTYLFKDSLVRDFKPIKISTKRTNKVYQDIHKNYWLTTNSDTLYVLNENLQSRVSIILRDKNLVCRNVLQHDENKYFICTNKGLALIRFADTLFKTYKTQFFDETNGLPSSDIYNIVFFNSNYYVSTGKGLCIFNSIESLKHHQPPNTIINAVYMNDSLIVHDKNNSFAYNKNNITFNVDALTYKKINQKGTFFKYKLEGLDDEFKLADGNTITYTNLPPGNYRFIAKAFYDNETEDLTPAEFSFTIKPAFWQTWWGFLGVIILIAALIVLFIKWRITKITKAEEEKAKFNQTIAEYRFTALKAQMDPHFIFNSVNVIQNLILEKNKEEAYAALGKFSKLIRMVLNQSDSVFATIEEEMKLINLYVEMNQLRVNHQFIFKTSIQTQTLTLTIPSLIIQPFIENALWHGILPLKDKRTGEILLDISLEKQNILVIKIQDNGVGRKHAELNKSSLPKHQSMGLKIINERLNAYKAMHNNCLTELNIFDLEEKGLATGTLVEIKIELFDEND